MGGRIGRDIAAVVIGAGMLLAANAARADDPGLIALGAGAFDFDHDNTAAEFRGEYRFATGLWLIKPLIGGLVTTDGSLYGYGGLRLDLVLANHYVIMPVATVGAYSRGDSGKNLGSWVEFKTGAEFAYRFDGGSRLGVAFDHISNAGLTKQNPGTENVMLMYSLPIAGAP